jgi:hypothetical protein
MTALKLPLHDRKRAAQLCAVLCRCPLRVAFHIILDALQKDCKKFARVSHCPRLLDQVRQCLVDDSCLLGESVQRFAEVPGRFRKFAARCYHAEYSSWLHRRLESSDLDALRLNESHIIEWARVSAGAERFAHSLVCTTASSSGRSAVANAPHSLQHLHC